MRKQFWFVLLISIALVAFGCGKSRSNSSEEQPAEQQQQAAAPEAAPEPAPEQPAVPPPSTPPAKQASPEKMQAAKAPAPVPKAIVVPAGTAIAVRTTNALSSESSKAGETFEASVAQPVVVGGVTVLPAGAAATGKIVKSASAGRMKGEGVLTLALTSLTVKGHAYNVITEPLSQTQKSRGKRSATMIGGGAARP